MHNRIPLGELQIEGGVATGYDHFRHTYGFIQALYTTLVNNENIVNYDQRERFSISEGNIKECVDKVNSMISEIQSFPSGKSLFVQSDVYTPLHASTTVQRELQLILQHNTDHERYFGIQPESESRQAISHIIKTEHTLTIDETIFTHIDSAQDLIGTLKKKVALPEHIQSAYQELLDIGSLLLGNNDNNEYTIYFSDKTISSLSRELYQLIESYTHLLYEIRLFLHKNDGVIYAEVIEQYPNFGIAHSTLQHLKK